MFRVIKHFIVRLTTPSLAQSIKKVKKVASSIERRINFDISRIDSIDNEIETLSKTKDSIDYECHMLIDIKSHLKNSL